MSHFRRTYRIILIILWFFIMYFYALYVRYLSIKGKGEYASIKRLSVAARVWSSGLSKILNLKIKVHGDPSNVKGLIVSNHLSYLDILTTGSVFPLRFTPKSEISNWPFLGWFIRCSKPIWIDRNSRQSAKKVLIEFIETLKNKINLIIFPEGTSTDGKDGLLPFKSTTFEAAAKGNLTVYPILIHYEEDDDEHVISWYGDITLFDHAWKVLGMKQINAEVNILDPLSPSLNRKIFAQNTHNIMDKTYRELYR